MAFPFVYLISFSQFEYTLFCTSNNKNKTAFLWAQNKKIRDRVEKACGLTLEAMQQGDSDSSAKAHKFSTQLGVSATMGSLKSRAAVSKSVSTHGRTNKNNRDDPLYNQYLARELKLHIYHGIIIGTGSFDIYICA